MGSPVGIRVNLQLLCLLAGISGIGITMHHISVIANGSPLILLAFFLPCWLYFVSNKRLILLGAEPLLHKAIAGLHQNPVLYSSPSPPGRLPAGGGMSW